MNVFFFGYTLRSNAGGIERYTSTILKELKKRGHTIYVYVLTPGNEDADFIYVNKDVPKLRYIDRFIFGYRIRRYFRRKGANVDLFFCGHIFLVRFTEAIARQLSITYDLFVYGIDAWGNLFRAAIPAMKSLRKVISISSFTTEQVVKQGFKGEVVYFPPLIELVSKDAKTAGIESDKIVLLTVSRLDAAEQYKGQDSVIKALEIVKRQFSNIEYWIVGRGNDTARLKKMAADLKLEDSVKFYGFVTDEELTEINQRADIFIMPSKVSLDPNKLEGEGFGIVFIESALYRKALIGPNIGGSTDIIQDGVNGLTCDPQRIEDIASCILKLVNNKPLRKNLGDAAYDTVAAKFSLQQFDMYFKPLAK